MKKRAKLGDVEITVVESEKLRDSVSVTDNSVEKGQDVSDHVKQESTIMDLIGVFTGDDAAAKIQQLRKYQKEGQLLSYIGRNMYDNMVLQTFERDHNKSIANGFYYNITLKQIRLATATEVEIKVVNPVTKQASPKTATKVKKKTNNGKQQPKQKTTAPYSPTLNSARVNNITKDFITPGGTMKGIIDLYTKPTKDGGGRSF